MRPKMLVVALGAAGRLPSRNALAAVCAGPLPFTRAAQALTARAVQAVLAKEAVLTGSEVSRCAVGTVLAGQSVGAGDCQRIRLDVRAADNVPVAAVPLRNTGVTNARHIRVNGENKRIIHFYHLLSRLDPELRVAVHGIVQLVSRATVPEWDAVDPKRATNNDRRRVIEGARTNNKTPLKKRQR